MPKVNVYLGHRSALLGKALYESDSLIIWRFSGEKVCFYERYASYVCTTKEELTTALKNIDVNQKSNNKLNVISKVYWHNPDGAINTISKLCVLYLNNDNLDNNFIKGFAL